MRFLVIENTVKCFCYHLCIWCSPYFWVSMPTPELCDTAGVLHWKTNVTFIIQMPERIMKYWNSLPECVVLFCFLCVSTVCSLMATLNAFPFNSGVVFHTQGNGMDLGHCVAASLLMSSNLASAPTRAEQRKLTKKHFLLLSLFWMPRQKSKTSICVQDRRAKTERETGRNTPYGHWRGYWWRATCVLARMSQNTTH